MRPNYKQIDMVGKYQIARKQWWTNRNFVFKVYCYVTCYNNYLTRFPLYSQNIVIYRIQQSKIDLVYVHSSYQALQYDNRPLHFIMHAEFTSITILLRALHVSVDKLRNQHFVPF